MAPKRAFGGVLRPFGGGFRGPNRERASVFSGAGRGRAGGSAVEPGRGQRVQRWGPVRDGGGTGGGSAVEPGGGASVFSGAGQGGAGGSAVEPGGGASVFSGAGRGRCRGFCGGAGAGPARSAVGPGAGRGVQRCRRDGPAAGSQKKCSEGKMRPPPGRKKSVPRGRCAAARTHTGTKKNGPRSVHFYFCYTTLLLYGLLLRDARPIHPAARQRLRTPGARLFCGRLPAACSPATACLPSISVCPSVGVTAVKASAIRSLSRSAARRSGLSRLAAGISAVRVAPRESLRPPPGSQFSAAGVTVLSRRGHSSQPSGVSAVRSPELAVPAARPLRRRGHSTTTSVWPSTCNWRISCVELT